MLVYAFDIQGRKKLVAVKQAQPGPVGMAFTAEPRKVAPFSRREGFRDKLDKGIEDQYMIINLQVFITTFNVLKRHI